MVVTTRTDAGSLLGRAARTRRCRAVAVLSVVLCGACSGTSGSPATSGSAPAVTSTASTTTPTIAVGGSGHVPRPQGIVAVQEYEPGDLPVFATAVFTDSFIAGVELRANWQDVEPQPNQFNWQFIDQTFAEAAASSKFVILTLVPGFGTPSWALQSPVVTAPFPRQYGPGQGQVGSLPVPWDHAYLSRWFTFLQQVADRYGSNPAFRMISAAGPTSVSSEMSLPNRSEDIAQWVTLGYTPALYEGAWGMVFQAYASLFPRQFFSLSLYPGLRIGDRRRPDAAQSTMTPQAIVNEGMQYKSSFALQTSGLTGAKNGTDLYNIVSSSSGAIVTGFQLTTSATNFPAQMGDAASPVGALGLTLQEGLAAHVNFLEVYEADVVNPAMAALLEQTAVQLRR